MPGHWNPAEELDRARLLIARRVDAMVILGGNLQDEQVSDMARALQMTVPPAPTFAVGDWVESTGGTTIQSRATRLGGRTRLFFGADELQRARSGRAP